MSFRSILVVIFALILASQIYWFVRAHAVLRRLVKNRRARLLAAAVLLALYLTWWLVNVVGFGPHRSPTHLTWHEALISAPFAVWVATSLVAFLVAVLLWPLRQAARLTGRLIRQEGGSFWSAPLRPPSRRLL